MNIKERLKKLELPFKRKYPLLLFVNDKAEIPKARAEWEAKHRRAIGDKDKVTVLILDFEE